MTDPVIRALRDTAAVTRGRVNPGHAVPLDRPALVAEAILGFPQ